MKLYINTKKQFRANNGTHRITRGFYETLPAPMAAIQLSDEKMTELTERINDIINIKKAQNDDIRQIEKKMLSGIKLKKQEQYAIDKWNQEIFLIEESTAVEMGMKYYEDLTKEEYAELNEEYSRETDRERAREMFHSYIKLNDKAYYEIKEIIRKRGGHINLTTGDKCFAYVYTFDMNNVIEKRVTAVGTNKYDDVVIYTEESESSETKTDEQTREDEQYEIKGGMVLEAQTLNNLCDKLTE